jgi:hypothetical protein
MPQLVALALVGAAVFTGLRLLQRMTGAIGDDLRRADEHLRRRAAEAHESPADATTPSVEAKNLGTLELDPGSGVYKPAKGRGVDR